VLTHRIHLVPAKQADSALMFYKDALIGRPTRVPLCAAAPWLLANGVADPADRIETYRNGVLCLAAPIAAAAKLTVQDAKGPPRFARWQPSSRWLDERKRERAARRRG
jgi:hypothetical protein